MSGLLLRAALAAVLLGSITPLAVHAGQGPTPVAEESPADALVPTDSAPPPVPPEVVSRDAAGRVTVRAVRTATPLRIDGRLDEEIYGATLPAGDFIQVEPTEGAPASQRVEFWLLFDSTY